MPTRRYQALTLSLLLATNVAADELAERAQWSQSVPTSEQFDPGGRVEAHIVDDLLHARRLDGTEQTIWHLILGQAEPDQPPTLEHLDSGVEVRHANGTYYVRDTFWGSTLTAHRQKLAAGAFAGLDTTARSGSIDANQWTAGSQTLGQRSLSKWEKDRALWAAVGPDGTHWDALIRLSPTPFVPQNPLAGLSGAVAFLRWDDTQLWDNGTVLIARYMTDAEAAQRQQQHKLARGAVPFNLDAQRWLNPVLFSDGKTPIQRLGWFKGNVVLLHFWATWSPESIEQLAHYDQLYQQHKDDGLVVIGIHSAEGTEDLDTVVRDGGYSLPIAVDGGQTAERYGVWNPPQSVLIGRDGRLAWLSHSDEAPTDALLAYLLDDADSLPTH